MAHNITTLSVFALECHNRANADQHLQEILEFGKGCIDQRVSIENCECYETYLTPIITYDRHTFSECIDPKQ